MLIDKRILMPPGEALQDMMTEEAVSAEQLAAQTGIPLSCVEGILKAEHGISPVVASRLERGFYGAKGMWLNMQEQYEKAHDVRMQYSCQGC